MSGDSFTRLGAVALTASLGLGFGLGCAGAERTPATPDYDPQTCVEEALRRSPDPALAAEAAEAFSSACALRDRASCSMLGVAYELGFGVPRSLPRARAYYRHACEAGNARACGNLGELVLAAPESRADADAAIGLLAKACADGHARHCAALENQRARGELLLRVPANATSSLDGVCRVGDGHACVAGAR